MSETPSYYSNINGELLAICPEAGRVLEFGCGAGRFLEAYKRQFPQSICVGFEKFEDAGKQAQERCDQVIVADAEDKGVLEENFQPESFDLIIYGDVLEHFVDPWTTFANHLELLKPGGTVCACIPNASHWSMIFSLVNGDFTYQDSGLLDRTHLHFFTHKTIGALFQDRGMTLEILKPRKFLSKGTDEAIKTLSKLLDKTPDQVSPARRRDWATFQYLVKATKP